MYYSRVSRRYGRAIVITFFSPLLSNTSLCLFFFQGISLSKYLWIFTSNISPHFAEFAGIKLAIISAGKILTALFLKFNKSEKIYYCWIFQTFIHRLKKKNKENRQISTVNYVFLCSLNTDNLGCILTLQVRIKANKESTGCV